MRSEPAVTFPALGLAPVAGWAGEPACERLTYFGSAEDFSTSASWELEHWPRPGMMLVDARNRCWRITRIVKGPVVGSIGGRMLRALVRQSVHKLEQELVELKPLSLDEVKARACEAIQANPDDWRDDEAIAGEDGPPREEQDLLDELKNRIRSSNSVSQILNALFDEHLEG